MDIITQAIATAQRLQAKVAEKQAADPERELWGMVGSDLEDALVVLQGEGAGDLHRAVVVVGVARLVVEPAAHERIGQ